MLVVVVVVVVGGVKASPRGRDETEKETEIGRKTYKVAETILIKIRVGHTEGDNMRFWFLHLRIYTSVHPHGRRRYVSCSSRHLLVMFLAYDRLISFQ